MLISFLLSIFYFTIHNRRQRTHKRGHDRWGDNPGRIHTAILASVRNHIDRYQLQRRNIQNQKRAHLIACNPAGLSFRPSPVTQVSRIPPLLLQLPKFLHRFQPRRSRRPAEAQNIRLCQARTKYFLYFCKLSCILQYYVTFWNFQHISYFYLLHFV